MKRGMGLVLLLTVGACSMGMKGPPARPWTEQPRCDTDDFPWVADVYGGYTVGSIGVLVLISGLFVGAVGEEPGAAIGLGLTGAGMMALGGGLAYTGLKGKRKADQCREARAQWSLEHPTVKPTPDPSTLGL